MSMSCWNNRPVNFYPRSPCGERQTRGERINRNIAFLSTLSLRRATRLPLIALPEKIFLSTLSLRRATHYDNYNLHCVEISIHALLAESDRLHLKKTLNAEYFYPRSPCGERLHYDNYNLHCVEISIHALLAESDAIQHTEINK